MANNFTIVDYEPEHLEELIAMWRESFERAVGVRDPHPIDEQRQYFESVVLPCNRVRVVADADRRVVGFMASTPELIAQLYVHVDHQRRGIGSALLALAREESNGRLRLFTFAANESAQAFYRARGFREIARGFESEWQLEDIELEWIRGSAS
jgi:ribosomal protein S18 acetylase RimI-like enzyme